MSVFPHDGCRPWWKDQAIHIRGPDSQCEVTRL